VLYLTISHGEGMTHMYSRGFLCYLYIVVIKSAPVCVQQTFNSFCDLALFAAFLAFVCSACRILMLIRTDTVILRVQ
jgi:hypothetical protein